jgi:hypothetical protein
MKAIYYSLLLFVFCLFSCQKSNSTSTPSSSMSASINGGSTINFTSSFSNSSGVMVLQGTSNTYSISIYIQIAGPGVQYFQTPSVYPYATVSNVTGSYSTLTANYNQISVSAGSSSGLYNGSFSFTGNGSAGSITVSGQFTNM